MHCSFEIAALLSSPGAALPLCAHREPDELVSDVPLTRITENCLLQRKPTASATPAETYTPRGLACLNASACVALLLRAAILVDLQGEKIFLS